MEDFELHFKSTNLSQNEFRGGCRGDGRAYANGTAGEGGFKGNRR
jgi:hypothetical protein